jgi:DedD protein
MAGLRASKPATVAREEAPQQEPARTGPAAAEEGDPTPAAAAVPASQAPPARPTDPELKQAAAAEAVDRPTRSEPPEKPQLDADGVPIAWILQVASVSSADKAEQLRKDLLAFDQKAYVKRVKRNDKVLYRVYIGPRFERDALEKMKGGVDAEFGVNTIIVRYYP